MFWKQFLVAASMASALDSYDIRTDEGNLIKQDPEAVYSLDPSQYWKKMNQRQGRVLRKGKIELNISGLESSFNWLDLLLDEDRLAVAFQLYQGKKYSENVVLYSPRDGSYRVLGLKDSTQYTGSVRLIRDSNQIQQSNSSKDLHQFRVDTPRIIQEKEVKGFAEFLSKVVINKIRLDSSSVTFKISNRIREHYVLEVQNLNETISNSKTVIHIVPNSRTIILNDLPANSILKMALRRVNSSSEATDVAITYLFTGSLTSKGDDMTAASTVTRLVLHNRDRIEASASHGNRHEEKTVPCHVVNRRPFDGYPCPQSQVCLPLHWRCDGQQDCPGGMDEMGCEDSFRSVVSDEDQVNPVSSCKLDEVSCILDNVTMCLPNKWLCDGRIDCSDGWDENKENCPKITAYTIPSLTQGIRRITNLLLRCRGAYFRCRSGECVSDRDVCDRVNHCDDASDELYCDNDEDEHKDEDDDDDNGYDPEYVPDYEFKCHPRYEFKCYRSYSHSTRRCIPKAWLCDAFQDCPYGEDENSNFCSHQHLFQGYF